MGVDLDTQGKSEWARQEFEALLTWEPAEKTDPWRRTSGLSTLKGRRALAILRELWFARDDLARERDVSPGRILPDRSLIDIAAAAPTSTADLPSGHRAIQRYGRQWAKAVSRGNAVPEEDLPPRSVRSDGPPPPRSWTEKNPVAAERLAATRALLATFADEHHIPVENVCSPDPLRRVVWSPPARHTAAAFDAALREHGVRPWQAEVVAPMLVAAFS
jgi:ribonuclease D